MQLAQNIIIFLYGIVIGSFLNVCIYRLPKHENIVSERSHCMECGHQLQWYELFPVFSFIWQRGRCRNCNTKLSIQYPAIELLNGILYVIIFRKEGLTPYGVLLCLLGSALIVLSIIDWRTYYIPLGINVFIGVIGILYTCFDYRNLVSHLIGMVGVSGFLFLLYLITRGRGIGDGDIKLMIGAGLFLGPWLSILALWIACLLGAIIHTIRMKVCKVGHQLAFGPYLAVGIMIAALYGEKLMNWYLTNFIN